MFRINLLKVGRTCKCLIKNLINILYNTDNKRHTCDSSGDLIYYYSFSLIKICSFMCNLEVFLKTSVLDYLFVILHHYLKIKLNNSCAIR